jgi:hypothetical protein
MPRHPSERMFSQLTGSIRPGRARHKPRGARTTTGQRDPGPETSAAPAHEPSAGSPIRLSGTCTCGRERRDVTIPGIEGDRWFRSVFTQCECGEVLLLTPAGPRPG